MSERDSHWTDLCVRKISGVPSLESQARKERAPSSPVLPLPGSLS